MANTTESKQNHSPASDLDDDIFTILNSSRPTYPGGGPNVQQQPATQLHRHTVSQTQPVTPHPQPVQPAAPQPRPVQPVATPTPPPQPVQPPTPQQTESQKDQAWRPVVQPRAAQAQQAAAQPKPEKVERPSPPPQVEAPLPHIEKRPVVSHAMPGQEEPKSEEWPDLETLEEIPGPEPRERFSLPKGRRALAAVIAIYALILVAGFAARFIIHAVRNANDTEQSSVSDSAGETNENENVEDASTESGATAENAELVSITPNTTYLAVLEDQTATIKVSLSAHGAVTGSALSWASSDENIATVDENGTVTGVSNGTCTITISAKDNPEVSATVDLAVRHLEERDGCTYVDDILIVNKTYSLPESYDPGGLTDETQAALDELIADAYAEGLHLFDASDYRSYADQLEVYQQYCAQDGWEAADTYSGRPGHSEHQTGMVIDFNDISDAFDDTEEANWVEQNCANYGFILRFPKGKEAITGYQYESWHIRYVGKEVAQEIMSRGITLEEYLGVDSEYKNTWPEDPCNPDAGTE